MASFCETMLSGRGCLRGREVTRVFSFEGVSPEIMRVRRLAKEIEFAFQLVSLSLRLLMIKSQVLVFLL